ncbi:MAG: ATP-binding protein [Pseudomonadota bacterium]
MDVISAVDKTYSELVAYQERLETQNAELDALRRFMASVLASVSDVLVVVGRDRMIEQASGSFDKFMGHAPQAMLGQSIDDAADGASRAALKTALDHVITTREPTRLEINLDTPNGPAPLDVHIAPRLDDRGKSKGAVLAGRAVGELRKAYSELEESHLALKETQAHLVRNEKLASLGRLLAGVAHELNNPISFVYANTHALEKYLTRFETYFEAVQSGASRNALVQLREELKLDRELVNLRQAISGARDGAERVRDIVEDLRRLSAEGSGEETDFDLVTTTRIAADWIERGTKTPVQITFAGASHLVARGQPGHVQQIVMNLVQNAIDALAETDAPAIIITHEDCGTHVLLRVCDNGPGVPPEIAGAIFDPFFTTKPVGKGTGLGLSISHKIAQEHGGQLAMCETQGGACFCLELPKGEAP